MSHVQVLQAPAFPEINNPSNAVVFTTGLRESVLLSACLSYHTDNLNQCYIYPVSDPFLFSDLLL